MHLVNEVKKTPLAWIGRLILMIISTHLALYLLSSAGLSEQIEHYLMPESLSHFIVKLITLLSIVKVVDYLYFKWIKENK